MIILAHTPVWKPWNLCRSSASCVSTLFKESNTSAWRTFYESVLPQFVHSLQVLKIQPQHAWRTVIVFQNPMMSHNMLYSLSARNFDCCLSLWSLHQLSEPLTIVTKTILMMRYDVLVISLFSRKRYCRSHRSHHSSTYRSASHLYCFTWAGIRE